MKTHNSSGWSSYSQNLSFQSPAIIAAQMPVADFTYAPVSPKVNEDVTLDASGSSNPDGETIGNYVWMIDGRRTAISSSLRMIKFDTAGDHTLKLVVSDATGHASSQVTKTISVIDNTEEKLTVYLPAPERIANWQTKEFKIIVKNYGETESGNIAVKLDLPPELTITSATPDYFFYYEREPKYAYWYINNINAHDQKIITFSAKFQTLNLLKMDGMRYDVTIKKISNAFYPGIGWIPAKSDQQKSENSRMIYADNLDAFLLKTYYETQDSNRIQGDGWLEDFVYWVDLVGATHVWLAYHNIFTPENYVTNTIGDTIGDRYYDVAFSHSGGTQTLYKKLERGDIKAKYVFFIAPALLEQEKLKKLIERRDETKIEKIFIVQSDKDILYNLNLVFERDH
ncbi:MAG: hypothetical protein STSR0009_07550 [Methanoregula sp.]